MRRAFYTYHCNECRRITRSFRSGLERCKHCKSLFQDSSELMSRLPGAPPSKIPIGALLGESGMLELRIGREKGANDRPNVPFVEIPLFTVAPLHLVISRTVSRRGMVEYSLEDIVDDYATLSMAVLSGEIARLNQAISSSLAGRCISMKTMFY